MDNKGNEMLSELWKRREERAEELFNSTLGSNDNIEANNKAYKEMKKAQKAQDILKEHPTLDTSKEQRELENKYLKQSKELEKLEDELWDKYKISYKTFDHGEGEGPFS